MPPVESTWESAPRYQIPPSCRLLAVAGLLVTFFALIPMLLLGQIRPGPATIIFVAITVLGAINAAIPLLIPAACGGVSAIVGLLIANLTPLVMVLTGVAGAPVQFWALFLFVPTLIMAASANLRTFRWQLGTNVLLGPLIIFETTTGTAQWISTSVIYLGILGASSYLTRRAWTKVESRYTDLYEKSHRDDLTGLHNRRGLLSSFPELRSRTLAAKQKLGILLIDIDHFTVINDEHGHPHGDEVLSSICKVVSEHSPPDSVIARIGGEELVVLVPGPAEPAAVAIHTAITFCNVHPGLTVSVGIVDTDPEPTRSVDQLWELIHLADSAMYLAKQNGRDRIVRLGPSATSRWDCAIDQNALAAQAVPVATGTEPTGRHAAPASRKLKGPGIAPASVRFAGVATNHHGRAVSAFHRLGLAHRDSFASTPDQAMPVDRDEVGQPQITAGTPTPRDSVAPYRIFGVHYLLLSIIGVLAYLLPLGIDPNSWVIPVLLPLLGVLAALGTLNIAFGTRLPVVLRILPLVCGELTVVVGLMAVPDLNLRMGAFGLIQVLLLIAVELLSRRALLIQFPLVLLTACAVAYQAAGSPGLWLLHTVVLAALICVPSGILYRLRQRCRRAEVELDLLGRLDPLTGLANRFGLQETLVPGAGSRHSDSTVPQSLYLIMANINGFKLLNDHFGHGFGDEALRVLARTLSAVTQNYSPGCVVARTAGDRFLVAHTGQPDVALFTAVRLAVAQMPLAFQVSLGQAYGEVSTTTDVWALTSTAERDLVLQKN